MGLVKKKDSKHPWPRTVLQGIEQLEKDGQPWAIARFKVTARFVEGEGQYMYELVLFQTYNNDSPCYGMEMDRWDFQDIKQKYGLHKVYESRYGQIFSKDHRLRDIVKEYNDREKKLSDAIHALQSQQFALSDKIARSENESFKEDCRHRRSVLKEKEKALAEKKKGLMKAYSEEKNLIIYNYY